VATPPAGVVSALSSELGTSRLFATILAARGVSDPSQARAFLRRETGAPDDPFLLKDMDRAVARIREAAARGERVCVWGDYDVDGLTATALLATVLEAMGLSVFPYIPSREEEGYGLNREGLRSVAGQGAGLVVTVDVGITAFEEARAAEELGLGLVITDHHEPEAEGRVPPADAVVNPRRPGDGYPFIELAGVGVAYKLAQALLSGSLLLPGSSLPGQLLEDVLDLVALGTVCDVVPLKGENRSLVSRGLELFNPPTRPGLEALWREAGLEGRRMTTYHLGFQFGPRLNAAGRLGDAERALALLLCRDRQTARVLAGELDRENRRRQDLQEAVLAAVVERIEAEVDLDRERAIVVAGKDWHEGVIGIVASRVVELYSRPALLVAVNDGLGRGSGRSIGSFDLAGALARCSGRLNRFGGHRMAAGFEILEEALDDFAREFMDLARESLSEEDLVRELAVDAVVGPELFGSPAGGRGGRGPGGSGDHRRPGSIEALLEELPALEPYGTGNPEPVLALEGVELVSVRPVGREGRHLKAGVRVGRRVVDAVGFGLGAKATQLGAAKHKYDIAFRPEWDEWAGRRRVQLRLVDLRPSGGV